MKYKKYRNHLYIIVFCIIYTIVFHPQFDVYAEKTSTKEKSEGIELPTNVLNIQKENTFKNAQKDTELLEPSKATKQLLKDSKTIIKNPDIIKMLNESTIQTSPIAIGYRATIYLGRWPLYYESEKTSVTPDYEAINVNELNNEKGDSVQQLHYKQKEEKQVDGLLTTKVDNAKMIKEMLLETAKEKTKLPLSFTANIGANTKLEHFYDVQDKQTGVLEAYMPAVNEVGKVAYGEVYINLKGSQKKIEIKNVTKQNVGAWLPIQDYVTLMYQTK